MFEKIIKNAEPADSIEFYFNDRIITAQSDDTIAAALFKAGITTFRQSPVSGDPRGPFCMMGACFECLVELDGEKKQACMTRVTAGMQIHSPQIPTQLDEVADE